MAESRFRTDASDQAPKPLIAGRFGPLRGDLRDARYQAFLLLWATFVVAPTLMGLDKFFNWMTYWPKYLWIGPPHWLGVSPLHFMYGVGVIEMVAGLLMLLVPRYAPYVVAGWLGGIVTNLLIVSISHGGHTNVFYDIALRDFGLFLAALALARLSSLYALNPLRQLTQVRTAHSGTGSLRSARQAGATNSEAA